MGPKKWIFIHYYSLVSLKETINSGGNGTQWLHTDCWSIWKQLVWSGLSEYLTVYRGVSQWQLQGFLYSSVASCISVVLWHNNKLQSLQSLSCSSADTLDPCCCLLKWWNDSGQKWNNIYRFHWEQKCRQPTPVLFLQLVWSSWYEQSCLIFLHMYRSVCGILQAF